MTKNAAVRKGGGWGGGGAGNFKIGQIVSKGFQFAKPFSSYRFYEIFFLFVML